MKTCKAIIALCCVLTLNACSPTIYKSNNFESSKETVKTVAILPFSVSNSGTRLPKGTTAETLKESQRKTGYDIQSNAYSWFLQRQKNYIISFQDVDRTNALLNTAGKNYDDISLMDKGELCKLLNVDAIISGKATLSKPMSEGAAVALGLLVGAWGTTNRTTTTLTIHDGKSDLLWKYDFAASGSIGSNSESLVNALMRNASKKFPYKVKK